MQNIDQSPITINFDNELSQWIRNCFIQKYDIEKILDKLDNDKNIQEKLEYVSPSHQQFDIYYYLIQTISNNLNTNNNAKKYLEYIVQSESFQNLISDRCHFVITYAESIDNLEDQIELLYQIFYFLKDIDMNILKQSNISRLFTLIKIIENNYPQFRFYELFNKVDDFQSLIQGSAGIEKYKNIPAYPQPLEFIQFRSENKQYFGEINKLEPFTRSSTFDQLFKFIREDYIYQIRGDISYLVEKGFYKTIKGEYITNLNLYQDVRLISYEIKNQDIIWKISLKQFDLDGRRIELIDWNYSKKLQKGSLICITNVECHPLLFGIITNRSLLQQNYRKSQRINIEFRFLGPKSQIMEFFKLLSQQTIFMQYKRCTLAEFLINYLESIQNIKYLTLNVLGLRCGLLRTESKSYQIFRLQRYCSQYTPTLTESQLKAIQLIVYEKQSVIIGLPGTGKTYCLTIAIKILIDLIVQQPILIICQNHHTLDHFLEQMIKYIPINKICRLGSTSKSSILQKRMFQSKSNIDFDLNEFQELKKQLTIIFNRLMQYDYTINAQDITRFWFELSDKLINDFIQKNNLNNQEIDESTKSQILNAWINVKYSLKSNLQYETQLFGVQNYVEKQQITNLVKQYDIFGHSTSKRSSQNEQTFPTIKQFNKQKQNQFNLNYDFTGIEKIQKCLQDKAYNFWELNYIDICEIIKYIKYFKYQEDCLLFEKTYKKYKYLSKSQKDLNDLKDIQKLNKYQIIGVTITDAAPYTNILSQLNSSALIIEEFDQVLQSDIKIFLTNNLRRLILIGNHINQIEQLQEQNIQNIKNSSLLRLLYSNQYPIQILSTQWRMNTKITDFVKYIYRQKKLDSQNIPQQINNQEIIGLNTDFHIFNNYQFKLINIRSKENTEEGLMIFLMVQYLIQVGYKQSQITILSFYQKQVDGLKKKFIKENQQQIKVCTVDDYFGEENDIVIISLVVNNHSKLFRKNKYENTIKNAFSRAKLGLYVFGDLNFDYITNFKGSLLSKILIQAKKHNYYSNAITLKCITHGTLREVQKSSDWFKQKAGCCDKVCNLNFDKCYHTCKKICHLGTHLQSDCQENCERILKCRHKCQQLCRDQCICTQMIYVELPICNHKALIQCEQDPSQVLCQQDQEIQFLQCKHIIKYKCYQRQIFQYKCQHDCKKILQCGHICGKKCWEVCQPCEQQCAKIRNCGHNKCQNLCYQSCSPCIQQISVQLNCRKHKISKECYKIQNHIITGLQITPQFLRSKIGSSFLSCTIEKLTNNSQEILQIFQNMPDFQCKKPCSKPRKCGHNFKCNSICSQQQCSPCEEILTFILQCTHKYQILCKDQMNLLKMFLPEEEFTKIIKCNHKQIGFEICNTCREIVFQKIGQFIKCQQKCIRIRQCGHADPCLNECYQQCSPCQQIVTKTLDCGHQIQIQCSSENVQCNRSCDRNRPCLHYFPCSNYCYQVCSPCEVEILINLPCNHQKLVKCYTTQIQQQQICEFCQNE